MSDNKKVNKNQFIHEYEKQLKETNEILGMMEDVFGHRVTSWSPKDTAKLKNKLRQPVSDKFLDSFIDLDTRISQKDYEPTIDLDTYKKVREPLQFKSKEVEPGSDESGAEEETPTKK